MSNQRVHWRVRYQGGGAQLPAMTQVMASHGVQVAARPMGTAPGAGQSGKVRVDLKADGAPTEIWSAAQEFLNQAPDCELEIFEDAAT
jgi:hypothetical protein